MSDQQTQTPTNDKDRAANKAKDKGEKMALFQEKWEQIQLARAALADLESQASQAAEPLVKAHGKGPHKMTVPDADSPKGKRSYVVQFQRVSHQIRFEATDITDLD